MATGNKPTRPSVAEIVQRMIVIIPIFSSPYGQIGLADFGTICYLNFARKSPL